MILLLQYIQLLSQIFLLNTTIIKNYDHKFESASVQGMVQFASFFQPGYWISFRDQRELVTTISAIFFALIVLRYVLFAYICKISFSKSSGGNNTIIKIWRFIFLLQGRVLCGFFVSFWVNMIVAIQRNEMDYLEISDSAAILICAILSILEYAFSFFLQIKFCYMLPTKSFLASKNNDLEIWTLFQKFILQLLQVILANTSSSVSIWIVVCVNLILSLTAKSLFLMALPLYNLKALKYLGRLIAILLTLTIACFFQAVSFKYFETKEDEIKFLIIIWIILACFGVRISDLLLNKLFLELITTKSFSLSPQLLIHKIIVINKIRKSWTQPINPTSPNNWYFLLNQGILSNLKFVLSQDDIQDMTESLNKIFINYIDKLLLKNPKNNFIKLYASYFYAKKIGYFAHATRLLKEFSSHQIPLTASLLQLEIQNIIRAELRKNHGILDIFTYLQGKEQVIQFKTKMFSQVSIQADIYKEIQSDSPDLAKIFDNSQKVNRLSSLIQKKLKRYLSENKEAPIELYMLFYEYSQKLNYSMSSFSNQEKLYFKRIEKFQQLWNNDEDSEIENLCQERCPVIIISGQRGNSGKIVYCSKSSEKVFGAERSLITGSHIASWAPTSIENFVFQIWKKTEEKADVFHFENYLHFLLHHRAGYLVKAHGNIGIHPFIGQGVYCNIIIRASINYKTEFILIQKNGEIDCASERIAKRLNLLIKKGSPLSQKPHIRDLCSELEKVNQAFNLVNEIDENYGMGVQEATELYSLYTSSGKDLVFKNINYCCKIEMMPYGDDYLKIMSLEEKNSGKSLSQLLQTFKKKQPSGDDYEETDYVESDFLEFEEGKQSALLETAPAKPSRFLKETIPLTESNLFTYETPTPLETGTLSSKRLLVQQQHPTSPFKKPMHFADNSIHESVRSKGSKEKRIETAYRAALNVKSCPKYFRAFSLAFYSMIIAIITAHVIYHYSLEKTVGNLIGKKQVLGKAQLSNFYLIQTTGFYRIVEDTIVQRFTPSEFGLFGFPIFLYLPFLSWVLTSLNNANQDLLVSTDTLTQENRDYIFTSDVKIYNNYFDSPDQEYMSLTNFEGTNRIVETGLAAIDQTKQDLTSGLDNFKFVYRNTLNDLLMKNSVIASFFYASFIDEFKEISILTNKFMIGTPLLLITITISLIAMVLKQYNQERINLASVTKLNPLRLKEMLASIQEFIVVVETEELVSDEFLDKMLDEDQQQYQRRIFKTNETKRGNDKTLNDAKIMKKYLILLLKALLFFLSFLIVAIVHLLVSKRSVSFFKEKSIQINTYDYIRNRIYLSGVASQELFSASANAEIENIPLATWTAQSPQLIQTLRLLVSDTLLAQDGSLDPEIQSLILKDGCSASVLETNAGSCQLFAQKGMKSGLMYLLSSLESIFETRQSSYQQSDKSEQALRDIEALDFNLLASITLTLSTQCNLIAEILNQQVEMNLSLSDEQRRTTTALGMSLLVILVIMIWFFVMRKFQKTVNDFKKVLKVLPADLALSSFILKNFLKSTSEGALDAVKSYI